MANSVVPNEGLKDLLKPFYQRASEAEDRLAKLEAAIPSNNGNSEDGIVNEECLKKVKELELKLEEVTVELAAEREKFAKLSVENEKMNYRIIHLVRALKGDDQLAAQREVVKLTSEKGHTGMKDANEELTTK